jgi:hypothetical protein
MNYQNFIGYSVGFAIANKRKQIRNWLDEKPNNLELHYTGRCGIEGLVWAKKQLKEFEMFTLDKYPHKLIRIEIEGTNSKRMRVYRKALKDYKYSQSESIIYKKIKVGD